MTTQHGPRVARRGRARILLETTAGLVLVGLTIAGCAGQGAGGGDDTNADGKIVLDFWNGFTGPDGPALQQVVDDFNASQDEIEVKTNIMPWDTLYQKVLTSVASDGGPDIIAMSASRIPQFADEGLFMPVDDYYENADNDSAALAEAAVEASIYDGQNYGVPVNYAPMMMYYNKDLFTAAGLDPEAPPATWDEFAAMVPQLSKDENGDGKPEQYAIALADHETVPIFPSLLWGTGGGIVSEDGSTSTLGDPETIEALEFWVSLVTEQQASPIGLSGADADKLFQTGKAAIEIVGPWMTTGFDEAGLNYGLAKPFAGPSDDAVLADVVSMGVPSNASEDVKSAAYEFFAFWNSPEGQVTWANGSGFPPTRADVADQVTESPYPAIFGAPEVADSARVLMPGIAAGGPILETVFTPALQRALNGEGTVADIFSEASAQVQAELDK
ncbi:ABC transporter substrate-binding protein [Microbacterium sp. CFH 90308]|uniref:ABC transporter substrate-binding protein n=1 Tax=Microbacterium salsuginis TaxID=2722803 RepID=A0ABX1K767_9MICO|nr:ABC transporter substrate-binding protein [Microbacterium sp. CFH 90308]NLP82861.1 ABC transporter substrate-binding protein [Microbacterium sp. CFH 90308]